MSLEDTPAPDAVNAPVARRPMCDRCALPQSVCLCHRVVPVVHRTRVLILQHPDEHGHAKGTARLLHLSLTHSDLRIGEVFDSEAFGLSLDGAALLYPRATTSAPSESNDGALTPPSVLVVLDGTWRQSRAMLADNPWLQKLPRWSLDSPPASRYQVRQAHRPGQLSTLEATVAALAQIEGPHRSQQDLLRSFDDHVRSLQARMGSAG